jgi:hypothetical protein
MASPFRIFRKHQKALMATAALLAIIAFVFLDPRIMDFFLSRGATDKVVVRSEYGTLRESQLSMLMYKRQQARSFLEMLGQFVASARPEAARNRPLAVSDVLAKMGKTTEENVVDMWLFSQMAQHMGMSVDDKGVSEFLQQTAEGMPPAQIEKVVQQMEGGRQGFSEAQLFSTLRDEIQALRIRDLYQVAPTPNSGPFNIFYTFTMPPGERWEYYTRLNRRATVEVAVVPVANYLGEVPAPENTKLEEFFDKYKEKYAEPESSDPGFRLPRRVSVEYVKADYDKFAAAVSEADIQARYEKDKDRYDEVDREVASREAKEKGQQPPAEKSATPEKSGTATKTPEKATEKPAAEKPATDKKADGKTAPAAKDAAKPVEKAPDKPAATSDKAKAPAAPAAKEPAKPAPSGTPSKAASGTSADESPSPFRLVSYVTDKPTDPKPAPAVATSGAQAAPAAAKKADATPAEKKSDAKKPDAGKPAEKKADDAKKTDAKKAGAEKKTAEKKPAQKKEEPLSRRIIRRELAIERMQAALKGVENVMEQYHDQWTQYDVDRIRNKSAVAPAEPNLAPIAKAAGLEWKKTGLLTAREVNRLDIGPSVEVRRQSNGALQPGQVMFEPLVFDSLPKYRFAMSADIRTDLFVFWKTGERKDRVPKFSEPAVQAEVLKAWKMIAARDKAEAAAKNLADDASKAKKSLLDLWGKRADLKVTLTEPFSWLTASPMSPYSGMVPPHLSEVDGVDYPGPDFMKTVFGLGQGELGIAMNQPKTVVYVVRMVETHPADKVLQKEFEVDPFANYATAALEEQQQIFHKSREEIRADAKLHWDREPDQKRGAQPQQQSAPIGSDDDG